MKRFIKNTVLFLLMTVVFIETVTAFMIFTDLYLIGYPGDVIYYSISKSKKKNSSKVLLLGDSVGRQLFSNSIFNQGINSLACNQAIGMVGQYLLLNNYLNAENKIDTLVIIYTPGSFENNLDQEYTYHYFLKPFDNSEYSSFFTETVKEQINKIPYHQFTKIPHIFATSWAPDFISRDQKDFTFLSPISVEYLTKIKKLSLKHNFKLIISPPPISDSKKQMISNMNVKESKKCDLEIEFMDYFSKIMFLDSTEFIDDTHLKHPEDYTELYLKELIKGVN